MSELLRRTSHNKISIDGVSLRAVTELRVACLDDQPPRSTVGSARNSGSDCCHYMAIGALIGYRSLLSGAAGHTLSSMVRASSFWIEGPSPAAAMLAGARGSSHCSRAGLDDSTKDSSSYLSMREEAMQRSGAVASTSQPCTDRALLLTKSAKRKAAEALLAARYTATGSSCTNLPSLLCPSQATPQQAAQMKSGMSSISDLGLVDLKRLKTSISGVPRVVGTAAASTAPLVIVHSCKSDCACNRGHGWCHFDVKMPHINWRQVFDESPSLYSTVLLDRGYERIYMGENLQVYVVEDSKHVEDALTKLRASMQDRVIAIDLEWKPEHRQGQFNPVALMQLSSATCCVLIRTSTMAYQLPEAVKKFLADPSVVVVGYSWDSADEDKMMRSFSFGRDRFARFFDLQAIANDLGYDNFGLAKLTKQVMGLPFTKSKSISRSNWAMPRLSMHQIKYAALDVLTAGQVFRGLRLWHRSPSECTSCRQPLGAVLSHTTSGFTCAHDGSVHRTWEAYFYHCTKHGIPVQFNKGCQSCGRTHPLGHKPAGNTPASSSPESTNTTTTS